MTPSARFAAFGGEVVVAVADPEGIDDARRLAEAEAAAFDRACSRFRDDSELSRLNRSAGRVVRVGPILASAIQLALRAADVSDGLVDLTIGAALVAAGYAGDFATNRNAAPGLAGPPMPAPGWRTVRFDAARSEVQLWPGTAIDLGATAKALYADRAARLVLEHVGTGVLISAGGDIAVAGVPPRGGWHVGLAEHHAGVAGSAVFIDRGGVATSGTTARAWTRGGRRYHHVIDPRTGRPAASRWRTVTVAAGSAADANIAATAAVILDGNGPDWLRMAHLPALLVAMDGTQTRVAGWPAETATTRLVATA